MSRVITFSRTFPAYHPRAGEPTYFVEKVLRSQISDEAMNIYYRNMGILKSMGGYDITGLDLKPIDQFDPKHHTIRAGHRWKIGDWFSPRVWSGKPYNSKQIQFAPDIQIKKVWDFEMDKLGVCAIAKPGDQVIYTFEYDDQWPDSLDNEIAKNDGLTPADFYFWFSRSPEFKRSEDGFSGQIICWNESIEYLK